MFFFSSRRRHTSSLCDWSSDVCSSDLAWAGSIEPKEGHYYRVQGPTFLMEYDNTQNDARSEERRVGKEYRCQWRPAPYKRWWTSSATDRPASTVLRNSPPPTSNQTTPR